MYKKKIKEEVRPCVKCKTNHLIYNRLKWLCEDCDKETAKERKGDLQALFLEIWKERPHKCVHCGKNLGEEPKAIYFSHLLGRAAYPNLKMDKENIVIMCDECHYDWDFGEGSFKKDPKIKLLLEKLRRK